MIENDKYFVYPRCSYTSNFGDKGQHHKGTKLFQVPLVYGERKIFDFVDCKQSMAKYDVFCEILPDILSRLNDQLMGLELVVDLYGAKEKFHFNKEYVLTSKQCDRCRATYGKHLLPIESNVIHSISGEELHLSRTEHVCETVSIEEHLFCQFCNIDVQMYFYNIDKSHYYWLKEYRKKYNEAQLKIETICNSYSYRIGRKVTLPFSLLKKFYRKLR
jgi:hypothetical protein